MATKHKPAKPAKKKTLAQRIAADPALKAKYLANPGLRSKLPDSALSPDLLKRRQTNTYNNAPITAGSDITNRMLNTEANNSAILQFGGAERSLQSQLTRTQQQGVEQAGWYDLYRQELAQHAQHAVDLGNAAAAQNLALGQGIRGLDNAQSTQQVDANAADAASRGATADPTAAKTASDASTVRQAMIASQGVQQTGANAANNVYADRLANVVAPLQKIQAAGQNQSILNDLASQMTDLQQRKGAANADYRANRIADESKNVLARQIAGSNVLDDQAKNKIATKRVTETTRHNTVAERNAAAAAKQRKAQAAKKLNKYGYTDAEWSQLGDAGRRKARAAGPGSSAKTALAAHQKRVERNDKIRLDLQSAVDDAKGAIGKSTAVLDPITGKPETRNVNGKDTLTRRTRKVTTNEVRASIRRKYKDPDVADAAIDIATTGTISRAVAARLRKRHIGVPKSLLPKSQGGSVVGSYVPPPGAVTGGGPHGDGS